MIGDRERAIAAGFDSYIAKPIDLCAVEAQLAALASRSTVDLQTLVGSNDRNK
jgi:DNA-binding response OmpR family regulator